MIKIKKWNILSSRASKDPINLLRKKKERKFGMIKKLAIKI